ncbi:MAG: HPr family phosphocarrier protein [Suipraeoptans sp.]
MIEKNVVVTAPLGLHARPVAVLANLVKSFEGSTKMIMGEKTADLKSVLNVMALQVKNGNEVTVRVEGSDEEEMCNKIVGFIENLKE